MSEETRVQLRRKLLLGQRPSISIQSAVWPLHRCPCESRRMVCPRVWIQSRSRSPPRSYLQGQNLPMNVDNGLTIVDGPLRYRDSDINAGSMPRIAAASYTNNDNDPSTATALFALDAGTGSLTTFPLDAGGPNGGVMATVGAPGPSFSTDAGFDISLASGSVLAALSTSVSGKSTLITVDLNTGRATAPGWRRRRRQ